MKTLIAIWVAVLLAGATFVTVVELGTAPSRPVYADDKNVSNCDPTDTQGRCADSCPDGQTQQGIDKDTGAALCVPPPSGCPYAPNLTANDPSCVAPQSTPALQQSDVPTAQPTFAGK